MARKPKSQVPPREYSQGWLTTLDSRTSLARAMQSRFDAMTADMGGSDRMSYAQRSLAERALWLEYWLVQQERELAAGKEFDISRWVQAANSLQGIFGKLGLERKSRDVSLSDVIRRSRAHECD